MTIMKGEESNIPNEDSIEQVQQNPTEYGTGEQRAVPTAENPAAASEEATASQTAGVVAPETGRQLPLHWKLIGGAGALILLGVGVGIGIAAKGGQSNEHDTKTLQPVASSTPNPGTATAATAKTTVPPATVTMTPGSATSTETSTPNTTTSTTSSPEQSTTTGDNAEVGTASVPGSYFEGLIDKSTVDSLINTYPILQRDIDPDYVKAVADKRGVTAAAIKAYQAEIKKDYANPAVANNFGQPVGILSPTIINTLPKQTAVDLIPQTTDGFRDNVAQGLSGLPEKENLELMNLVSLNKDQIRKDVKSVKEDGVKSFALTTHADEMAVVPYETQDGAKVDILVTVATYSSGQVIRQYFVNIPIPDIREDLTDSCIAVPFDTLILQ